MSDLARRRSAPERVASRYDLLRCIGRGGMGEIFIARDVSSGQLLALKRLRPSQGRLTEALFRAEYHTLAGLNHPSIVSVFEYGVEAGLPFYTMELLDGHDLGETAPIPYRDACAHLRDIASALALLHARRLLHRDISPRNVRKTGSGRCKLIDFGALASFGVPSHVAGTLAFVSPEAWEGAALDQRADLYSLGALAHWLLSGRLYSPTRPKALARYVRRAAQPIPEALCALVMSLLETDPEKRPSSATEVILRLNTIAHLEPEDSVEIAHSFLTSSRFVGRKHELSALRRGLERASRGLGGCILIEGAFGTGKTRLLQEASLLAQTKGVAVLRGSAARSKVAPSLAQQLYAALRRRLPESLYLLDPDDRAELAALEWTSPSSPLPAAGTSDAQARFQRALGAVFAIACQRLPCVVLVDDLDLADEPSAAFVSSLARQAQVSPLLLVATVTPSSRPRSIPAWDLGSAVERQTLSDLAPSETLSLCVSLFGHVPNLERLVGWLLRAGHGNPGLTMELTSLLLRKGVLRYVDGCFVLPQGEIREPVPTDLAKTLLLRLESLSPEAGSIAAVVAVCREAVPLTLCIQACAGSVEDVLSGLNELVRDGVLAFDRRHFSFAQQAMREAVRMSLDPAESERIHRRLAAVLLSQDEPNPWRSIEAGWHLMHTADALKGATLIAQVAPELIESSASLGGVVSAAVEALEILERAHVSLETRLTLRAALARASYLYDHRLADRYGEETVEALYRWSQLYHTSRSDSPVVQRLLFYLALTLVTLRNLASRKVDRGPNAYRSLVFLGRALVSLMGVRTLQLNGPAVRALFERIEPFKYGPRRSSARAIYLTCRALALQPFGRESELEAALAQALEAVSARRTRGMTPTQRRDLRVGLMLSAGINDCYKLGRSALARADALSAEQTPMAAAAALRIRLTYYAVRGIREQVERYRRLLDLHGIQGGTTWQVEWFAVPIEGMASALLWDVVSARHALERLERLAEEVPSLQPMRDMLRVAYCYRSGEIARAVELGEQFVSRCPPRSMIGWSTGYAMFAAALNELGQAERARDLAGRALAQVPESDREFAIMYGPLSIELAIACAILGDHSVMDQQSRAWVARCEQFQEHSLLLVLHEGRARAARLTNDEALLADALTALRDAADRSQSPTVRGVGTRIAEHARRAASQHDRRPRPAAAWARDTMLCEYAGACSLPGQSPRLLRRVLDQTGTKAAHLFVVREGRVALAASCADEVPSFCSELVAPEAPQDLADVIAARLDWTNQPQEGLAREDVHSSSLVHRGQRYQLIALSPCPDSARILLAIAATDAGDRDRAVSTSLLAELAQWPAFVEPAQDDEDI